VSGAKIQIDGEQYEVLDSLGWQPSAGVYAKEVKTNEGPRIAVKKDGVWRWWTSSDRQQAPGRYAGQSNGS
jgi:hypothetical protein